MNILPSLPRNASETDTLGASSSLSTVEASESSPAENSPFSDGICLFTAIPLSFGHQKEDGTPVTYVTLSAVPAWLNTTIQLSLTAGLRLSQAISLLLEHTCPTVTLQAFEAPDPTLYRGVTFSGSVKEALPALLDPVENEIQLLPSGLRIYSNSVSTNENSNDSDTYSSFTIQALPFPAELLAGPIARSGNRLCLQVKPACWPLGACYNLTGPAYTADNAQSLCLPFTGWLSRIDFSLDNRGGPWRMVLYLDKMSC